jgi:hypothetical protein
MRGQGLNDLPRCELERRSSHHKGIFFEVPYRYLEIFEFVQAGNFPNVGKIDLDLSSLYLLAAPGTTDEARAEVIEQAKTKKLTHADVKKTVARRAKPKKKKAVPADKPIEPEPAPVEIVEPDGVEVVLSDGVEEAPVETVEYMLVRPDAAPGVVYVDAAPVDIRLTHLQDELFAAMEDNEQLRLTVSDLTAQAVLDRNEIGGLAASRAALDDRRKSTLNYAIHLVEALKTELDNREGGDPWSIDIDCALSYLRELQGPPEQSVEPEEEIEEEPAPPTQPYEEETVPPEPPAEPGAQTWEALTTAYNDNCDAPLPEDHPKLIGAMVNFADNHGWDVEQLDGAPEDAKRIWLHTAKNCRVASTGRNTHQEFRTEILRKFGSGKRRGLASMVKSLGFRANAVAEILDTMFQTDLDGRITREKVGKEWMYTIRRPDKAAAK